MTAAVGEAVREGVDAAEFRQGMRQLAAAVSIVTTEHDGQRAGMTATAVTSLTAEPPQIGVAINRNNASYGMVAGSRRFAVNVLSHEQAEVAATFAGMTGVRGDARFSTVPASWGVLHTGAPVLEGSAASFDCELVQEVPLSSHVLVVGLVRAVRVTPVMTPLLFMDGTWASLVRADTAALDTYEELVGRVDATMQDALAATDDPTEQFAAFIQGFAGIYEAEVAAVRRFYAQPAIAPAARLDAIQQRKRAVEQAVEALIRRGQETGRFLVPDPGIATQAIFGMFGSIHRWPDSAAFGEPGRVAGTLRALAAAVAGAPAGATGEAATDGRAR